MKKKSNKNIGKEVIIFLLLVILIMLILAVALYDFVPSNITIPEPIEYSSDSKTTSIKQEIAYTNGGDLTADESNMANEDIINSLKSYNIDASDLSLYGQKNLYNSGNSNPFDYAAEEPAPETGTTPATTASGENNSTSAETSNSQNSTTGTFFENSNRK